jgi:hypothetical protein
MSELKLPIYLDYSSTTPVDPRVAAKMADCLTTEGVFGNPASRSHKFGWVAEEAVDIARNQIADLVNADPREIVFTSGATESNNLAIKGAANFYGKKNKHLITIKTEHKAVLDTCTFLEEDGFEDAWGAMLELGGWRRANGFFDGTRSTQARYWFEEDVRMALLAQLDRRDVAHEMKRLGGEVARGDLK